MGSTDATIEKPTVAADEEKVETENELVPEEEVLEGDWMRPQVNPLFDVISVIPFACNSG